MNASIPLSFILLCAGQIMKLTENEFWVTLPGKLKFFEARDLCKELNGTLPRLQNISVFESFQGIFWLDAKPAENRSHQDLKQTHTYVWSDGSRIKETRLWPENEPNCQDNCCALTFEKHRLKDFPCGNREYATCVLTNANIKEVKYEVDTVHYNPPNAKAFLCNYFMYYNLKNRLAKTDPLTPENSAKYQLVPSGLAFITSIPFVSFALILLIAGIVLNVLIVSYWCRRRRPPSTEQTHVSFPDLESTPLNLIHKI